MNKSANKNSSSPKATIYSAFLLALAVLLLIVSCPLQHLLQNNFVSNISSAVRSNQANIKHRTQAEHSATANCCVAKNKTVLVKPDVAQQYKLPVSLTLSNITQHQGFEINYFLSGISNKYCIVIPSHLSSLPLFLQHRSLLI
jgi:uncharacterized protein (UPF0333 family)